MAIAIQQISPVAHLPLVLGVVRTLNVAALIDAFCPPHPAHVLSCGRGVEALLLAILDGHHALYKVGARLEERGMLPLLQDGLRRASLNDYRLGQILDALFAAQLNRVFGAIALNALEVYALSTPWLHQDTTTISLYGAYEEAIRPVAGLVPPRPAYGHSKDGRDDLKQVLLSLGVSSDGLPLRLGVRDGHTSDSTETPIAIEECVALGLDGVRGIVADSKAYCKRTLGLCLEQRVGLITLVPRTCAVRQAVEAWGQQHGALPLLLEKPGRTRQEPPRRWYGQSVVRRVEVEYADGRLEMAELRFLVVHSSQLAHQAAVTYAAAQAKEAAQVAEHIARVEARWFACAADAEAAIAEDEGRGQGRPWAQAAALALPYPPLPGRSGHTTAETYAARPSPQDRAAPGQHPVSPQGRGTSPRAVHRHAGLDRPGDHRGGRELYRYRDTPDLSGATYHRRTRVSLDQESRRHQPGVARETRTDCGLSHAHGRGIARVCGHPTAGPTVSPRSCSASPRE
jgi:transposase